MSVFDMASSSSVTSSTININYTQLANGTTIATPVYTEASSVWGNQIPPIPLRVQGQRQVETPNHLWMQQMSRQDALSNQQLIAQNTVEARRRVEQELFNNYVNTTATGVMPAQPAVTHQHLMDCNCDRCVRGREDRRRRDGLAANDPDWGDHKVPPQDWYSINKRRMTGEKTLLSMMDWLDRCEWFENKCVRIQYPQTSHGEGLSGYGGRTLLLTPQLYFEFKGTKICCKRNIWIGVGDPKEWSYEDQLFAVIMNFQMNPRRFVLDTGCRSNCYRGDYPEIERWFEYGYDLRQPYIIAEKKRLAEENAKATRAELKMLKELEGCPSSL